MKIKRNILLLMVIMAFFSSTAMICEDDKESDASLNNVWEVKSMYAAEAEETVTFPLVDGHAVFSLFIEISENSKFEMYAEVSGIPAPDDELNGVYSCPENIVYFTLDGNNMVDESGDPLVFKISGNSLTLTFSDGSFWKCKKASASSIQDAEADCSILNYDLKSLNPDNNNSFIGVISKFKALIDL